MFRRLWRASIRSWHSVARVGRRAARSSVWGPDGLRVVLRGREDDDGRFAGIFRWVLPLTDVFFFWFGAVGWWNGIATVEATASPTWQSWWSASIAAAALVAFVGLAFPRLWWVEVIGKLPLIGLVSVYVVIFAARGADDPLVAATAGLICILILLPIWRLFDLSGEWRLARAQHDGRHAGEIADLEGPS